jgi:hypothetical protein
MPAHTMAAREGSKAINGEQLSIGQSTCEFRRASMIFVAGLVIGIAIGVVLTRLVDLLQSTPEE